MPGKECIVYRHVSADALAAWATPMTDRVVFFVYVTALIGLLSMTRFYTTLVTYHVCVRLICAILCYPLLLDTLLYGTHGNGRCSPGPRPMPMCYALMRVIAPESLWEAWKLSQSKIHECLFPVTARVGHPVVLRPLMRQTDVLEDAFEYVQLYNSVGSAAAPHLCVDVALHARSL